MGFLLGELKEEEAGEEEGRARGKGFSERSEKLRAGKMKECELCQRPARMYCESDQASLCWTCDAKVHSANFLVARHTRSLLCQACQAPTPWRAAGARLGPTVSVCQKCVGRCGRRQASDVEVDSGERAIGRADEIETVEDEDDYDYDYDDDDDDDDEDEAEEEEDGENQVVPWTSTPSLSLSGPVGSLSSEDESSGHGRGYFRTSTTVSMKRRREDEDFLHQEKVGRSSSQANYDTSEDGELSPTPSRAPKDRKITSGEREAVTVSRTKLAGTLRITQNERWKRVERTSSAVGTCSRREESLSAVDLVSDGSESRPM
ncbi:zinc finger protein CONSTANS-LIKE 2 [Nymphaea colorata]|nr:zinc finger protein CONSTANS-LIKE 2 [Nymphaea colorata]